MDDKLNNKGLNLVHLNIRSLFCKNKFDMFKQQLLNSNVNVLGISETWLKKELPSDIININGFNINRNDRSWSEKGKIKKGGGVCIYIKKDMLYSDTKYNSLNISSKDIESQWLSLNHPKMREIVIINVYRPPQGNCKTFFDKLNENLSSFEKGSKGKLY